MTDRHVFGPLNKKLERLNHEFLTQLQKQYGELTPYDINLAGYLQLKLSTREIGLVLNIAPESVKKAKHRLRKKLCMTSDTSFADFFSHGLNRRPAANNEYTQ